MTQLPTLRELLDAGVHFGHKTSRRHPKMSGYIFTSKAGVHVINLEQTAEEMKKAVDFVAAETAKGALSMFIGTKKQSCEIVKAAAISCGSPYVNVRWLGGCLTNFDEIRQAVRKFEKDKAELENPNTTLNKSELSKIRKDVARGEKFLEGLIPLVKKPDILILFGSHDEKNAVKEAKVVGAKIVALCDTNADPSIIDFPIPANDDATKSVKLFAELFAKAINENKVKKEEAKSN